MISHCAVQELLTTILRGGGGVNPALRQLLRQGEAAQEVGGWGGAFAFALGFKHVDGALTAGNGETLQDLAGRA
jgi:hypothetical protein